MANERACEAACRVASLSRATSRTASSTVLYVLSLPAEYGDRLRFAAALQRSGGERTRVGDGGRPRGPCGSGEAAREDSGDVSACDRKRPPSVPVVHHALSSPTWRDRGWQGEWRDKETAGVRGDTQRLADARVGRTSVRRR